MVQFQRRTDFNVKGRFKPRFESVFLRGIKIRTDVLFNDPNNNEEFRLKGVSGGTPSDNQFQAEMNRQRRDGKSVIAPKPQALAQLQRDISQGKERAARENRRIKEAKRRGVPVRGLDKAIQKEKREQAVKRTQQRAQQRATPTTQQEVRAFLLKKQGWRVRIDNGGNIIAAKDGIQKRIDPRGREVAVPISANPAKMNTDFAPTRRRPTKPRSTKPSPTKPKKSTATPSGRKGAAATAVEIRRKIIADKKRAILAKALKNPKITTKNEQSREQQLIRQFREIGRSRVETKTISGRTQKDITKSEKKLDDAIRIIPGLRKSTVTNSVIRRAISQINRQTIGNVERFDLIIQNNIIKGGAELSVLAKLSTSAEGRRIIREELSPTGKRYIEGIVKSFSNLSGNGVVDLVADAVVAILALKSGSPKAANKGTVNKAASNVAQSVGNVEKAAKGAGVRNNLNRVKKEIKEVAKNPKKIKQVIAKVANKVVKKIKDTKTNIIRKSKRAKQKRGSDKNLIREFQRKIINNKQQLKVLSKQKISIRNRAPFPGQKVLLRRVSNRIKQLNDTNRLLSKKSKSLGSSPIGTFLLRKRIKNPKVRKIKKRPKKKKQKKPSKLAKKLRILKGKGKRTKVKFTLKGRVSRALNKTLPIRTVKTIIKTIKKIGLGGKVVFVRMGGVSKLMFLRGVTKINRVFRFIQAQLNNTLGIITRAIVKSMHLIARVGEKIGLVIKFTAYKIGQALRPLGKGIRKGVRKTKKFTRKSLSKSGRVLKGSLKISKKGIRKVGKIGNKARIGIKRISRFVIRRGIRTFVFTTTQGLRGLRKTKRLGKKVLVRPVTVFVKSAGKTIKKVTFNSLKEGVKILGKLSPVEIRIIKNWSVTRTNKFFKKGATRLPKLSKAARKATQPTIAQIAKLVVQGKIKLSSIKKGGKKTLIKNKVRKILRSKQGLRDKGVRGSALRKLKGSQSKSAKIGRLARLLARGKIQLRQVPKPIRKRVEKFAKSLRENALREQSLPLAVRDRAAKDRAKSEGMVKGLKTTAAFINAARQARILKLLLAGKKVGTPAKSPAAIRTAQNNAAQNTANSFREVNTGRQQSLLQNPLDKPTVTKLQGKTNDIGKSKTPTEAKNKANDIGKEVLTKEGLVMKQIPKNPTPAMANAAKAAFKLGGLILLGTNVALARQLVNRQPGKGKQGTPAKTTPKATVIQKQQQKQAQKQNLKESTVTVQKVRIDQLPKQKQTQIINAIILGTFGTVALRRGGRTFPVAQSRFKGGLFGFRRWVLSKLKRKRFIFTPDIYSIILGVKAKPGQKLRLLKPGRVFTGLERRALVR